MDLRCWVVGFRVYGFTKALSWVSLHGECPGNTV